MHLCVPKSTSQEKFTGVYNYSLSTIQSQNLNCYKFQSKEVLNCYKFQSQQVDQKLVRLLWLIVNTTGCC